MTDPIDNTPADETPAAVTNTETPPVEKPENRVPQSRFNEVNNELKKLKADIAQSKADAEAAVSASALAKAKEDADYQKQIDLINTELVAEKAKSVAAQADKDALILGQLQVTVANKHKLPTDLASRLLGTTEAELDEDAKKLAKSLPASAKLHTPADGKEGINPPPNLKMPDDATIKLIADQTGQPFEYMKTYYENLSKEK